MFEIGPEFLISVQTGYFSGFPEPCIIWSGKYKLLKNFNVNVDNDSDTDVVGSATALRPGELKMTFIIVFLYNPYILFE